MFGLHIADASTYEVRNFTWKTNGQKGRKVKQNDSSTDEFILKIVNHVNSVEGLMAAQSSWMLFLIKHDFHCQKAICSRFGGIEVMCKAPQEDLTANRVETTEVTKNPGAVETEESVRLTGGIELSDGEEYASDKLFLSVLSDCCLFQDSIA